MPVIKTYASTPIPAEARDALKSAYGQAITAVPGKSEGWLMCLFEENVPMYFGGTNDEPSALVEVGVYARAEVPASAWQNLTEQIIPTVAKTLKIDPARIYVSESSTPNFGWNGSNF